VAAVEAALGSLDGTTPVVPDPLPVPTAGVAVHEKSLEQVHVCLGTGGIPVGDPDRYAARILELALGGGMSSRLFQEVREKRGHAYTIYSFLNSYTDAGYFGVYVGTSAERLADVLDVIGGEFRRVVADGLLPAELTRTKNQMKGNMLLGLETSDSRMTRLARNEIYYGRDVPVAEIAAAIDRVENDDVVRVAGRILGAGPRSITVLGDLRGVTIDAGTLDA
jgi:predicted Zn-dependent peptidase